MTDRPLELLPFQLEAVKHVHDSFTAYDAQKNLYTVSADLPEISSGEPKPYLHRIKAVTGAGKTPILARLSGLVGDSIILWTTPMSAVISQTKTNLDGKYRHLLPADTEIYDLSQLSPTDWREIRDREKGLTILVATVASFNQKGDRLKLHQEDDTGMTRWQQLKPEIFGGMRQRDLYVFYDEGHNVTTNQFARLLELRPRGLFLVSASNPSKDLGLLLPGETFADKERIFNEKRTTVIPTSEVVKTDLLKRGVEIHDCDVAWQEIVRLSCEKLEYLQQIGESELPIACFIVNRTEKGLDVWRELCNQGVSPERIAVHLSKASDEAKKKFGGQLPIGFRDTYTDNLTPEDLRQKEFTHLIWNLSLKEGWDEPWAYVAYIHDEQKSVKDIEQRIGRFIRNPNRGASGEPSPFQHPDLNKSYFYFNCKNTVFSEVLQELKQHLETEGFDTLKVKDSKNAKIVEEVAPREQITLPRLAIFPETEQIGKELLDSIIIPAQSECDAPGRLRREELKLAQMEISRFEEELEKSVEVTSGTMVRFLLEARDSRIVKSTGSTGGWLDPGVWEDAKLNFKVCYGSPAARDLKEKCDRFCSKVDQFLKLDVDDADDEYVIGPYRMSNPNGGDSNYQRGLHKVHSFKRSIHPRYNGFNDFELRFAKALDTVGLQWARNPARTGYGIPLLQPAGTSRSFYPDFIVWSKSGILFLETKGGHLLTDATQEKLVSLAGIRSLPSRFRVILVSDTGVEFTDSTAGKLRINSASHSLLYRDRQAYFRSKNFTSMSDLVGDLVKDFT